MLPLTPILTFPLQLEIDFMAICLYVGMYVNGSVYTSINWPCFFCPNQFSTSVSDFDLLLKGYGGVFIPSLYFILT